MADFWAANYTAGGVLTAKQAPHRPGITPALAVRTDGDDVFILPQTPPLTESVVRSRHAPFEISSAVREPTATEAWAWQRQTSASFPLCESPATSGARRTMLTRLGSPWSGNIVSSRDFPYSCR